VNIREFLTWNVHHNAIWSGLFNHNITPARKVVLFKLRRLLYEEVLTLKEFPNFRNGAVLGYCLNVLGLQTGNRSGIWKDDYALRRAVIGWAHRNYLWLVKRQPKVAKAVLLGTITFDPAHKRLVKTYMEGLSKQLHQSFFKLDAAKADAFLQTEGA